MHYREILIGKLKAGVPVIKNFDVNLLINTLLSYERISLVTCSELDKITFSTFINGLPK